MNVNIKHKDPRFCRCYSLESYCPIRSFSDYEDWCSLGYYSCSASGNATYDSKSDAIIETNVDFDDLDNLKDEWFGPDGPDWVVARPQKCIDELGE